MSPIVLTELVHGLLMKDLISRKQETKVALSNGIKSEIKHGIPQRYIPLLFAIFICDLFYVIKTSEICNFAENNILHSCRTNLATVLESPEHDASIRLYWFISKNELYESKPRKFSIYDPQ